MNDTVVPPSPPLSNPLPVYLEPVPDELAVRVYHHAVPTKAGGEVPCWSYVTDGLRRHGQQELVFTLRRRSGETQIPQDPLDFFARVLRQLGTGQVLEAGGFSRYRSPDGFLGRTGTLAELNGWVGLLPTLGRAGVANSIIRSTEALGHVVDAAYLLYLQRPAHTPEDERCYTELALRLLDAVDVSERTAIAERLAVYSAAPRPLIERLARDVDEVAAPILDHPIWLSPAETAAEPTAGAVPSTTPLPAGPVRAFRAASARAEAHALSELFYTATFLERRLILANLEFAAP